jgi:superfamily I DNA/RNA helicase
MTKASFTPTPEQEIVITHSRSAFISACPGAGKTQVLVERARNQLKDRLSGQGIAFLSFTNAAISEFRNRLQLEALLHSPPFPHFVGTFDSFLWQFLIAPFGVPGHLKAPQLIPDLGDRSVTPYPGARPIPLSCFDNMTGELIPDKVIQLGFDPTTNPALTQRYVNTARRSRERFIARGELDFTDVRTIAKGHLANPPLSKSLSAALAGRFREIIVDEAQDCNPADVEIIDWLRGAGIVTKVICDPHQSIYEFRGGVTNQLFKLGQTFDQGDRLTMRGNFRSNHNICKAIATFRAPSEQDLTDQPLGKNATDKTQIYILSYAGNSVPASIGVKFGELVQALEMNAANCPVLSSTRDSACNALGQTTDASTQDRTFRLALAITSFHLAHEINARKLAMEAVHKIVLEIEDRIGEKTYHQHVAVEGLEPADWRPSILALIQSLRYDPHKDPDANAWLARARKHLSPHLAAGGPSISQRLRNHKDLGAVFAIKPTSNLTARTIHSAKGMQFPAVCVVMTTTTTKGILDYLTTDQPSEHAEGARKLYVAASRAERLLAIAVPKSQAIRLTKHIQKNGAQVAQISLGGCPPAK